MSIVESSRSHAPSGLHVKEVIVETFVAGCVWLFSLRCHSAQLII